ncbi:MAG: alpha/beta hydrolase family protein [Bacteroidota bacterium]
MKTYLISAVLFLLAYLPVSGQSFSIGHRAISTTDPARSRTITLEVYYPADVAGDLVPFTQQPVTAPILVFGHGFVMSWDAYANLWQSLVPHGYLMAFVTTETGFSPDHLAFGKDLAFTVGYLQSLANDPSDVFYQRLDSASAVMGHSMGGGSAFLAVGFNPSIRAIATLAAAETNPSAIAAASAISLPALVLAGGNDCVTPPPQHQIPMYNALTSACKTYVSINGASHCQMANSNFYCSFGESTCTPAPAISRTAQHQIIDTYLIPWLDFQLRNDCLAGADFDNSVNTNPAITYQRTCQLCTGTGSQDLSAATDLRVFNQSESGELRFEWDKSPFKAITFTDMVGRKVFSLPLSMDQHSLSVTTAEWAAGIYRFGMELPDGTSVSRKILVHSR